ncbi:MAG: hypothetical protein SOT84_12230 [Bariatricus sp.]|nr:hypothetical protein [Bariatricus sp.]
MSSDSMQERLKQTIEDGVVDYNHEPAVIPEGTRLHVNCFVKKRKEMELANEMNGVRLTSEYIIRPQNHHQWYDTDEELYGAEIKGMRWFFPQAKCGFFKSNGAMWWAVDVIDKTKQKDKVWRLLIVYDQNHPLNQKVRKQSSVKVYPIKPSYSEIQDMMSNWSAEEQVCAGFRFYRDDNGAYLDIGPTDVNPLPNENPEVILSAAGAALRAKNWIDLFERSLFDENYRRIFCNKKTIVFRTDRYRLLLGENHLEYSELDEKA